LSKNTGLPGIPAACAENIDIPLGTTTSAFPADHGSKWRASARSGSARPKPGTRRSNIATARPGNTKPGMCTVSTAGYSQAFPRIACAGAVAASHSASPASAGAGTVVTLDAARWSCRRS